MQKDYIIRQNVPTLLKEVQEKEVEIVDENEIGKIYLIEAIVEVEKHQPWHNKRKATVIYKVTDKKINEDKQVIIRIKRDIHTKNNIKILSFKKLKFLGHGVKE